MTLPPEFRKQMVVNPDDHYAHNNLGNVAARLRDKCSEAIPEPYSQGLPSVPTKPNL